MLTKEMIKEAQAMVKSWNTEDDYGIYLDKDLTIVIERVPEWADSWSWIDGVDLKDLFDAFEDYYGVTAKGNTFEDLLDQTVDYNFVVEDYTGIGETYMLSDLVSHIYNFD